MGFPFEHGLRATLATMRLADLLDVDAETSSQTFYSSLLMYSGCTTDIDTTVRIFGGNATDHINPVQHGSRAEALGGVLRALPPPDTSRLLRPFEVARRLPQAVKNRKPQFRAICEVASMLAERLGLPPAVHTMFAFITERWDGDGALRRAEGEGVPLPVRIVHVGRDAIRQRLLGGDEHAVRIIRQRSGHAFDPDVAEMLVDHSEEIFSAADAAECWEPVLAAEPRPWLWLEGDEIDRAVAAMGYFADLVCPWPGHSQGVADLAESAAAVAGFDAADLTAARRAGHLHDLGRVAVHPRIWQKAERLSADEWEQVRLHAYHTERILSRSTFLSRLGQEGGAHHERLDGSGYHRGVGAATLSPIARLLGVCDSFQAMTEPRPYRPAMAPEMAAEALAEGARAGVHDPELVSAVVSAAGQPAPRFERPAGLSEREAEVLGLVARGMQTKQVARALAISVKTADSHIQNTYRKIGVSTRAAATIFAIENGLVASGELPIP